MTGYQKLAGAVLQQVVDGITHYPSGSVSMKPKRTRGRELEMAAIRQAEYDREWLRSQSGVVYVELAGLDYDEVMTALQPRLAA